MTENSENVSVRLDFRTPALFAIESESVCGLTFFASEPILTQTRISNVHIIFVYFV